MAILQIDGFDHYTSAADIDRKWDSGSNISSFDQTAGRFGGGAANLGNTGFIELTTSGITTIVMGGAIQMSSIHTSPSAGNQLMLLYEAGQVFNISIENNGGYVQASLGSGGAAPLGVSADPVFESNTWHYLEVKVVIAATATGSVEVHVDGTQVLNLTSIVTSNGGNDQVTVSRWTSQGGAGLVYRWDDVYLADSGSILGDVRVDTIMPDGDGNYTELGTTVPASPTTHWDKVEELQDDDDTSYNQGAAANQRDTFTMENLTAITNQTIHAVQQFSLGKHDGTATNMRNKLRISATDYDGASQALTNAYEYYLEMWETNPNTSLAWAESEINGLESGMEQL